MAGLPQWEYIVIILCGEVILAVGITLLICWRCRWAKQDKSSDEKKPLPCVDEMMDDMFTKDSNVINGHPPLQHDYSNDHAGPWLLVTKSKRDELFSAKPKSVGFKNDAFTYFDHEDAVEVKSDINDNESVKSESDSRNNSKIRLLAVANTQFTSHSRESSLTITPVDISMNDLDTPMSEESFTTNRSNTRVSTPVVVRSAAVSNGLFAQENFRNQFNRDMELMRSPPPSYTSALGRRTNPLMGEPVNLTGDDDNSGNSRTTRPLWESKLHD